MAEENEEQDESQDESKTEEGGGKIKLIIIIVVGLLFLGISVGATLYLLGFFDSEEAEEVTEEVVVEKKAVVKPDPAMYFPIKPSFVINFQSRGRQRFLQVDVAVMTRNQTVYNAIQAHLPLIKNRLVMLFSGQVYEELQSDEGRELLRQKSLESIKSVMDAEIGQSEVDQILFTNFVMQ